MAVYFIRKTGGSLVKIGFAGNPWLRLQQLRCGRKDYLELARTVPGGRIEERKLHFHYRASARGKEWFEWCGSMMVVDVSVLADPAPYLPERVAEVRRLAAEGLPASLIAECLGVGRIEVYQIAAIYNIPTLPFYEAIKILKNQRIGGTS